MNDVENNQESSWYWFFVSIDILLRELHPNKTPVTDGNRVILIDNAVN